MNATADEFGAAADAPSLPVRSDVQPKRPTAGRAVTTRAALLYIAAIAMGSAIAAMQRGDWSVRTTLGPGFEALWGNGVLAVVALLGGGILVGIGTRMAGGCTSGHGLSGCSRFQPGSLVSTATFMAAAVAMTFVLRGLG